MEHEQSYLLLRSVNNSTVLLNIIVKSVNHHQGTWTMNLDLSFVTSMCHEANINIADFGFLFPQETNPPTMSNKKINIPLFKNKHSGKTFHIQLMRQYHYTTGSLNQTREFKPLSFLCLQHEVLGKSTEYQLRPETSYIKSEDIHRKSLRSSKT